MILYWKMKKTMKIVFKISEKPIDWGSNNTTLLIEELNNSSINKPFIKYN